MKGWKERTHSYSVVVFHVEVVVIIVVEGIVVAVVFVGHSGCFGFSVFLLSLLSPVVVTKYQTAASSWLCSEVAAAVKFLERRGCRRRERKCLCKE
jgi:hypothetical protein